MECLVGPGPVCCNGLGIGTSVTAERPHRAGAKGSARFLKHRESRHMKHSVKGESVSPRLCAHTHITAISLTASSRGFPPKEWRKGVSADNSSEYSSTN